MFAIMRTKRTSITAMSMDAMNHLSNDVSLVTLSCFLALSPKGVQGSTVSRFELIAFLMDTVKVALWQFAGSTVNRNSVHGVVFQKIQSEIAVAHKKSGAFSNLTISAFVIDENASKRASDEMHPPSDWTERH
jgi:hypothetical protein